MEKDKFEKEFENSLKELEIEKIKDEFGIVDEGDIVPEEDLAKIDEEGNVIEE